MWDLITCIKDEHDLRLVAVAAVICVIGSVTALRFQRRAFKARGPAFWTWALLTAAVAGSAVWATHFVAMLAYSQDIPIRYDLPTTIASFVIAIVGIGAGLAIAASSRSLRIAAAGGVLAGLGIVAMHFVGITAIRASFTIEWNMAYVVVSVGLAAAGGATACLANRRFTGVLGWVLPALAMVLGIVGLHFTAMTAIKVVPDLTLASSPEVISRQTLAFLAGGAAFLILIATGGLAVVETLSRAAGIASIQAAFRNVPAGLALFDHDGRLQVWNDAYAAMMAMHGLRLEQGMHRKTMIAAMIAKGDSGLSDESRSNWLSGHDESSERVFPEWKLPNGQWRRAEMHPVKGGGSLTVLSDITEEKRAASEMAEAVERAEAASRAKSDFVANMSHEIRTPLNGVLGMAQVMEADDLSPAQRERLGVIRDSGTALLGILNDILDLSKVQAGKMELEANAFDVLELANATLAAFQGAASAKGVGLAVDFDPDARRGWMGDPLRLRQVLSNLLGNALKFTTEGTVRLEVTSGDQGLILRVRDTGIGMDQEQIPRLFEKFSQEDTTTTRRYGGTGLGLAICQELVGLMGGAISATSEKGRGSCFTVIVPLENVEIEIARPMAEVVEAPSDNGGDVLRVLAAEDNRTNQIVLRSLLAPLGAELTIAENGREAVEAFAKERFDIVLMDAQMPEMNGVEATIAIRRMEEEKDLPRTPIVALSANVMTHQIEEYMAAGMDGWVAKPIELAALYGAIETALNASQEDTAQEEEAAA